MPKPTDNDRLARDLQADGPILAVDSALNARSIDPTSPSGAREGERLVQILNMGKRIGLGEAKAILRRAHQWNALDEEARRELLMHDRETHGLLQQCSLRVKEIS